MSQQLMQPFNAAAIDPTQSAGFKPLMIGKYPCMIIASEIKANKDNTTGGQVVFEVQAVQGEHTGKTGQWILNLYHNDEQTRQIAERQLSAICHATGQFLINMTSQLHNLPFALDVSEQQLNAKQLAEKADGKNVTAFRNVRVLNPDGSDVTPQGQTAQQPAQNGFGQAAQQPAQQPAQGFGQASAPAAQGWGQQPAQSTPAPSPAPAGNGWQQGAAAGGAPAWGKR